MLEILRHHHLFARLSRCSFGLTQVEYLGHCVSGKGVAVEVSKVAVLHGNFQLTLNSYGDSWASWAIIGSFLKATLQLQLL